MTSNAAIETAQANGLPPNVEPCEPGVNTSSTSLSAKTTEIGSTPPPSAFPKNINIRFNIIPISSK